MSELRRLRIMQVVLSLSPGGTERLVIEICRSLESSVESVVCCLDEPGEWASELTARAVPVHALGRTPGFHPSLSRRIARLARQYGVDALHCHHYSPFVYGVLASSFTPGLGVLFTEHGRLSDAPPSRKRLGVNRLLARLPAKIYSVSEDLKAHMVAEGFPARRVDVVHNGIAVGPRPTADARASARRALEIPDGALVVGTVGRLDPVKHLSALLTAHASVLAQHPRAHLVIVGGGPERAALEELAASLRVAHAVRFVGHRSDVRRLLPAFDVYANCSTHEGVSLTILEAMAAMLPVVATRVGGNPEVVMAGETGLLVPSRSPGHLAAALSALLADARRRHDMGEAGRWRVKRYFNIERMVDRYRRGYERFRRGYVSDLRMTSVDWRSESCAESVASSRSQAR